MIQEAHVGLGIYGKEGRNAARSADFAFAKFKFLRRALIVHGYLYYTRASYLVQYFFYKNFAFVICQVYFAFWNAFSVASLYSSIVLTFYNITLTAAPILFLRSLRAKRRPSTRSPRIPTCISPSSATSISHRCASCSGTCTACGTHSSSTSSRSCSWAPHRPTYSPNGKMADFEQFSSMITLLIFLVVHLKLLCEWHYLTWFTVLGFSMSIIAFLIFCILPQRHHHTQRVVPTEHHRRPGQLLGVLCALCQSVLLVLSHADVRLCHRAGRVHQSDRELARGVAHTLQAARGARAQATRDGNISQETCKKKEDLPRSSSSSQKRSSSSSRATRISRT